MKEKLVRKLLEVLKQHGVTKAGLFGSAARGDATKNSDVDLLVELPKNVGLLEFVGLKLDAEDALGKNVDLVEYAAIKPALRKRILAEEVSIL